MYRMLAGRLPFRAETTTAMMFQHAYEQPVSLQEAAPGVPQPLIDIVTRLLAKDPALRYQSCGEVLEDLAPLMRAGPWPPGRKLPPRRARWPFTIRHAGGDGRADRPGGADRRSSLAAPGRRLAGLFRRYAPEFIQETKAPCSRSTRLWPPTSGAAITGATAGRSPAGRRGRARRRPGAAIGQGRYDPGSASHATRRAQGAAEGGGGEPGAEGGPAPLAPGRAGPCRRNTHLADGRGLVGRQLARRTAHDSSRRGRGRQRRRGNIAYPPDAAEFAHFHYKVYRQGQDFLAGSRNTMPANGRRSGVCRQPGQEGVFLATLKGGGVVWVELAALRTAVGSGSTDNRVMPVRSPPRSRPRVRDDAALPERGEGNGAHGPPLERSSARPGGQECGRLHLRVGAGEAARQRAGPPAAAAAVEARPVPFVIQSDNFTNGDKIVIEEVRSRLGSLAPGDTMIVKGPDAAKQRHGPAVVVDHDGRQRGRELFAPQADGSCWNGAVRG